MSAVFDVHPCVDAITRWSALDRALARWVLAHGGDVTLAQAAGWASHADSQGNSALMLDAARAGRLGIAEPQAMHTALAALAAEPANGWVVRAEVAAANRDAPFVLDGYAFYLRRNFLDEVAVGQALRARLDAQPTPSVTLPEGALPELFPDQDNVEESPQRMAVRAALGQRLFVLTGGPGTGKTSTVLRLLMAQVRARGEQAAPMVCLAAPTGKAAQRLSESLREGALRISAMLADHWQPVLSHVLLSQPGTVHRLLAVRGDGRPGFHRDRRLPADIVVVDEASMLDMALLRALLDALRDDALLVLVGDADQLAPVGIGTAFADLVGGLDGHPNLVRLQHSFRASRELVAINEAVRVGDRERFDAAWRTAGRNAIQHRLADRRALTARLRHWADGLADALQQAGLFATQADVGPGPDDLARLFGLVRQRQLLCALREGQFGAIEANRQIERRLRAHPALAESPEAQWYPGRLVLITRNDYSAGLFNGDIGICLQFPDVHGKRRLQVLFEAAPDGPEAVAPRRFDPVQLPPHEAAFALTIHKSQGSEYDHVAVLLPPLDDHPLLLRQMLYTALSRARHSVELWAEPAAINACITTPLGRAGRLTQRLDPDA